MGIEELRVLGIALDDQTRAPATSAVDNLTRVAGALDKVTASADRAIQPPSMVAESFRALAEQQDRLAHAKPPAILSEGDRLRALARDAEAVAAAFTRLQTARAQAFESALAETDRNLKKMAADQRALERDAVSYGDKRAHLSYLDSEKSFASRALPRDLLPSAGAPQASAFQSMLQSIGRIFGPEAASQTLGGARLLSEAADRLGPLMPLLRAGASLLAKGAVGITAAAAALAAAAAFISVKALSFVARSGIEASDAKTRALAGLGPGGAATRAGVLQVAVELGLDPAQTEDFMGRAKRLLTTGFAREQIPVVLKTVANFETVVGRERSEALSRQLEKIASKGLFNQESVNGLAESGIKAQFVYQKLAASLGLTLDQVRARVKAGQVDVKAGIAAILQAAEQQAGGAAALASNTVTGKLNGIKTLFGTLFEDVDTGPLKDVLSTFTELLGGPGGAGLKGALTELGGEIFKTLFGPFQGPEGRAKLEALIKTMTALARIGAQALRDAAPYVKGFVDALIGLFGAGDKADKGEGILGKVRALSDALYALLTLDPKAYIDALNRLFNLDALSGEVQAAAAGLGSAFVNGFVNAITAGADAAVSAAAAMVRRAIGGAQAAEDAHSPSRVTAKLGTYFADGFHLAIAAQNDNAYDVGARFVAAATGGASDASVGAVGAADGSGGPARGAAGVTIVVQVTAAPGVSAAEARAQGEAAGDGAYQAWLRNMRRFNRDVAREVA